MISINNINIINDSNNISRNSSKRANWLQLTNVNNNLELSTQYAHICQQHKQQKKWVLFINPEESSIEQLAHTHDIDASKILMVNYKNNLKGTTKVGLAHIKSVLSKGNCSAVIVSNSSFKAQEIAQLASSARKGETRCFLFKNTALVNATSVDTRVMH
ncbi:MAG: cell division inhibitor SulA [Colwellia sp.]|jgi:cell division inhibitor SulA|tara:strand:- start:16926 stop:17402 length:477 start_codon:yes stop_codon:yes gene_type:complete